MSEPISPRRVCEGRKVDRCADTAEWEGTGGGRERREGVRAGGSEGRRRGVGGPKRERKKMRQRGLDRAPIVLKRIQRHSAQLAASSARI